MDERREFTLAERLDRLERRVERHELDHLHFFRLTLAAVSIAVALVGLAIVKLAMH